MCSKTKTFSGQDTKKTKKRKKKKEKKEKRKKKREIGNVKRTKWNEPTSREKQKERERDKHIGWKKQKIGKLTRRATIKEIKDHERIKPATQCLNLKIKN